MSVFKCLRFDGHVGRGPVLTKKTALGEWINPPICGSVGGPVGVAGDQIAPARIGKRRAACNAGLTGAASAVAIRGAVSLAAQAWRGNFGNTCEAWRIRSILQNVAGHPRGRPSGGRSPAPVGRPAERQNLGGRHRKFGVPAQTVLFGFVPGGEVGTLGWAAVWFAAKGLSDSRPYP